MQLLSPYVIPNVVRDLQFKDWAKSMRSLAALGMTYEQLSLDQHHGLTIRISSIGI